MNPQPFVHKYNGRGIDFDHAFGNQCVDLIQQYNKEVFNGPFLLGANALAIWNNNPPSIYTKVFNTPTNIPHPGDIIFWAYNHVALVLLADEFSLTTFDQNYPSQGYYKNGIFIGTGVCHVQQHTYADTGKIDCLGWFTPNL